MSSVAWFRLVYLDSTCCHAGQVPRSSGTLISFLWFVIKYPDKKQLRVYFSLQIQITVCHCGEVKSGILNSWAHLI